MKNSQPLFSVYLPCVWNRPCRPAGWFPAHPAVPAWAEAPRLSRSGGKRPGCLQRQRWTQRWVCRSRELALPAARDGVSSPQRGAGCCFPMFFPMLFPKQSSPRTSDKEESKLAVWSCFWLLEAFEETLTVITYELGD